MGQNGKSLAERVTGRTIIAVVPYRYGAGGTVLVLDDGTSVGMLRGDDRAEVWDEAATLDIVRTALDMVAAEREDLHRLWHAAGGRQRELEALANRLTPAGAS